MSKRVYIKPNEHVFIAGRTGSGKTFLARNYLAGYENVVVLDTKGTLTWEEAEEVTVVTHLADISRAETGKIIYRPVWEELAEEFYNAFFRWCYERGNTIVWVDEVMSVCPNAHRIPEFYKAILTRGRELNVAAWSITQRPANIPLVIMSESTHFFVFDLNLEEDRKRLTEITGMIELSKKPGKYNFWYARIDADRPIKARLVRR